MTDEVAACEDFGGIKFLGATVLNFSSSLGWNEQSSSVTISLAEDNECNGGQDDFTEPEIGSPVHFEVGDFEFDGIVQHWEYKESSGGRTIDVILNDPREILECVQVILDGFMGTTYGVPNLMNAYAWAESADFGGGFGAAQTNEAGAPWNIIKQAIMAINTGATPFGSQIQFKSDVYNLDFSNLPQVPDYYRITGASTSLLSIVNQIAIDSGCDIFIKLTDAGNTNTISFKCVSRQTQPAMDYIQQFVASKPGASVRNRGKELRNGYTSFFITGGNRERLYVSDFNVPSDPLGFATQWQFASIWPYWGLDRNGNAIIGTGFGDKHEFVAPIDIPGLEMLNGEYRMTVGQLRAALIDQNAWQEWMSFYEPEICVDINLVAGLTAVNASTILGLINSGSIRVKDLRSTTKDWLNMVTRTNDPRIIHALYEFVLSYANDYYGKKFMVLVPFVAAKLQSETGMVVTTSEPCEAGWSTPGGDGISNIYNDLANAFNNVGNVLSGNFNPYDVGAINIPQSFTGGLYVTPGNPSGPGTILLGSNTPLGLPWQYQDMFTNEDTRYRPFVRFDNAQNYNLENIDPQSAVIWNGQLFMMCEQEPNFVYLIKNAFYSPRVVITLPSPLYSKNTQTTTPPNWRLLVQLLKDDTVSVTNDKIEKILKNSGVNVPSLSFADAANMPTHTAVCLRSNILTYGPWYVIGVPGRVSYEKDEGLVPWNFGGYQAMDYTAAAKIAEAVTNQQEGEVGVVDVAGLPELSLGDELIEGGPNVTDISCSIAEDGATTNYRLKTYTPLFARFATQNADRLRRVSLTSNRIRRSMLEMLRRQSQVRR